MQPFRRTKGFSIFLSGNSGFTLVEELVTGMVSTILVAAVMTVFTINTKENDEGIGNAMLQMSSGNVSEEIGRNIRNGNRLLMPGETWNSGGVYTAQATKTVMIYSAAGDFLSGFRVNGVSLEEKDGAGQWKPFKVGNSDVQVDTASGFSLMESRREAVVTIRTVYTNKNKAYTAMHKQEMYRCRN